MTMLNDGRQTSRPDLLSKNSADQGLLAIIADLERRVAALEKQWRKATSSGTST